MRHSPLPSSAPPWPGVLAFGLALLGAALALCALNVVFSVDLFNEGVDVTLWSGVSPKTFTTLTVTRERNDGDQASSGEKVLVGTVDAAG